MVPASQGQGGELFERGILPPQPDKSPRHLAPNLTPILRRSTVTERRGCPLPAYRNADGDRAMEQQRWRQIEQVYHSARKRDPGQRPAYLSEVCGGDEDLRREIQSLLAQDASRDCVLDRPAAELVGDST